MVTVDTLQNPPATSRTFAQEVASILMQLVATVFRIPESGDAPSRGADLKACDATCPRTCKRYGNRVAKCDCGAFKLVNLVG